MISRRGSGFVFRVLESIDSVNAVRSSSAVPASAGPAGGDVAPERISTIVPPMRQHMGQRMMHMLIRSTCMRGSRSSGFKRAHVWRGVGEIGPDVCTPQNVQTGGYVLQCKNTAGPGQPPWHVRTVSRPVQLGRFTMEISLEKRVRWREKTGLDETNKICI